MVLQILDGRIPAERIKKWSLQQIERLRRTRGWVLGVGLIRVGEDPASERYLRNQLRVFGEMGVKAFPRAFPADVSQKEIKKHIEELNQDSEVDGIFIHSPLPFGMDPTFLYGSITPEKDVEGQHPYNLGRLYLGQGNPVPCTAQSVMRLLEWYGFSDFSGRNCTVVGQGAAVGRAISLLLFHHNATVTMAHIHTRDLAEVLHHADLVVSAAGKAGLIEGKDLKKGAVVVDVGTNVTQEGQLVGDVDVGSVSEVASALSPVPGGVGLLTLAVLTANLVSCATWRRQGYSVSLPPMEALRDVK